ncbi:MAG: prevent-host-death protein [Oxalobacter sp.]|nr:MAG: prevent-host-death protein [Oxalobacter sp.]
MKTATLPALRVDPKLRRAAERVLQKGETLSSFVEQSVRANIERRQLQAEFIKRGLASLEQSRQSGEYYSAETVMQELDDMLTKAEAQTKL